jgi:hypothetical protein
VVWGLAALLLVALLWMEEGQRQWSLLVVVEVVRWLTMTT